MNTPQNFSKQNLQGRSFKNQNLVGANFSDAQIQGANFTGADLTGANFTGAKAGLQCHQVIFLILVSLVLSVLSGLLSAISGTWIEDFFTPKNIGTFGIAGVTTLIVLVVVFVTTICQGFLAGLRAVAVGGALAVAVGGMLAVAVAVQAAAAVGVKGGILPRAGALTVAGAGAGAGAVGGMLVGAGAAAVVVVITVAAAGGGTEVLAGVAVAVLLQILVVPSLMVVLLVVLAVGAEEVVPGAGVGTVALALTMVATGLGIFIAFCILVEDEKNDFIRIIAVAFATTGGTSFRGANLTDADFTVATLRNTDFRGATLTRTSWHNTKKLHLARVGKSILAKKAIRDLLVNRRGDKKNYAGENLQGANLTDAVLNEANFKEANLVQAKLNRAELRGANLTKAQALGADFTNAHLTGACLEAWNIDSTTKIESIESEFIYLLEYPYPGTDNRERRPSSGNFAPGEFTKLFQEVLDTVDLIFRNGVDWKVFIATFQKVQVENENTELTIQSIENKGDGVVVVRVSVPPDTNKEKIHLEFTQGYELALKAIEEKYQATIEGKDDQITIYRQQLEASRQREIEQNSNIGKIIDIVSNKVMNLPVNEREVKAIADYQLAFNITVNLVILTLDFGDFEKGFSVTAQIWIGTSRLPIQYSGTLPPAIEMIEVYHRWHSQYSDFISPLKHSRIKKKQGSVSHFSKIEFAKLAEELEEKLNKWLNAEQFAPIDRVLRERFNRSDEVRIIIQSANIYVRQLPWYLWDFLKPYRKAEIALGSSFYDLVPRTIPARKKIRILSILGDDKGINIDQDKLLLAQLDVEVSFVIKPAHQELNQYLWDKQGWDILCFSGHSSSEMDGSNGWIYINDTEKVTIPELKNGLMTAIERGLQIVIFNSCDGLGLANQLASLHIPQTIVMREPVPDIVAQEFLKHFLTAFAGGKSFYLSVREAREKLESLEHQYPCATWLPVICQNPAEIPPTWDSLRHNS